MDKVFGAGHLITATFTRPTDATPYAAGDVVGPVVTGNIQFPGASREEGGTRAGANAGLVIIQDALLTVNVNQATKLDSELWIFEAAPTAVADNAVFAPTNAELLTLLGIIAFPSTGWKVGKAGAGSGGNAANHVTGLSIPVNTLNGNTLFAQLVARNVYTPVALPEVYQIRLKGLD